MRVTSLGAGCLVLWAVILSSCDWAGDIRGLAPNTFRATAEGQKMSGSARFEHERDLPLTLYMDTGSMGATWDGTFGVRIRDDQLATVVAGDHFSPREAYYTTTQGVFRLGSGDVRIIQGRPDLRGTFSLNLQREVGVWFPFTVKAKVTGSFAVER